MKLPYALLRARSQFVRDANHKPADYGENIGRGNVFSPLGDARMTRIIE